jgi:hypothetical protein
LQALQKIFPVGTEISPALEKKAELITSKKFSEVSALMPTTVDKAVTVGLPMMVLGKAVPGIVDQIEYELIMLAKMVNVDARLNLQKHQLPIIAADLYNNFKCESLEDVAVCLKRGAAGLYGEIYRIDGSVITGWMTKYLDEKYEVLVAQLTAEKGNPYEVSRSAKTDMVVKLMKDALDQDGFQQQEKNNAKENAYQRWRLEQKEAHRKASQLREDKQTIFNRVASEFYKDRAEVIVAEYRDDEDYYVLAENKTDAELIHIEAEKQFSLAINSNGSKT